MAEVRRLLATHAAADADRRRRLRQDPPGAAGRPPTLVDAYPDGVWLVELAPLADPALVPQAVAGALGVREQPGQPILATLLAALRARAAAAGAGQLRAPARRLRRAGRGAAARLPRRARAGHQPRAARRRRRGRLARALAGHARPAAPAAARRSWRDRGGAAVRRAGAAGPAGLRASRPRTRRRWRRSAGGWTASRWRSSWRRRGVTALTVEQIAARLDDRFRLLTGGRRTALRAPADAARRRSTGATTC